MCSFFVFLFFFWVSLNLSHTCQITAVGKGGVGWGRVDWPFAIRQTSSGMLILWWRSKSKDIIWRVKGETRLLVLHRKCHDVSFCPTVFSSDANQKVASSAEDSEIELLSYLDKHGMGRCRKLSTWDRWLKNSNWYWTSTTRIPSQSKWLKVKQWATISGVLWRQSLHFLHQKRPLKKKIVIKSWVKELQPV